MRIKFKKAFGKRWWMHYEKNEWLKIQPYYFIITILFDKK